MNKLFPILGLAAGGLLILGSKKKANAAVTPPGATGPNPTAKQKRKAEYMTAIAHAMKGSYEDLVKVLNAAVKEGVLTQAEAATYQKKHPKFPKAQSGSSNAAKPKSDLDKRIATALATNNPEVIRALADELERTSPDVPKETIANLRQVANELDAKLRESQDSAPPVLPPVAPPTVAKPPVSVARKKKPAPKPKKTDVDYNPVVHAPKPVEDSRQQAIDLARHLTGRKKGTEDKSLVEAYQRNENRVRVANNQEAGLNPDGKYGLETAMSLGRYDLVPPKPLYWGKGTYASMMAEKKQWKDWCLTNAKKDSARSAEWTGASKV